MTGIEVFLGGQRDVPVGRMSVDRARGHETLGFEYDREYLRSENAYALCPDLPLVAGRQTARSLPGAFADAAPDRWGRRLIDRRISHREQEQRIRLPQATESTYLLGVADLARQGNLRFQENGEWLAVRSSGVPKIAQIGELLRAADAFQHNEPISDEMRQLLDTAGSSMGGARPKASILDEHGKLTLAKFPKPDDDVDVSGWEATSLELARRTGLSVTDSTILRVGDKKVILLPRFDRDVDGCRVGYISAMTALERTDGGRASYLEIAEFLSTDAERVELWKRIAFNVAIENTDDHLRNHGFLRRDSGWQISPAFDINPSFDAGRGTLSLDIDDQSGECSFDLVREAASAYGVPDTTAESYFRNLQDGLQDWRSVANSYGTEPNEIVADRLNHSLSELDQLNNQVWVGGENTRADEQPRNRRGEWAPKHQTPPGLQL